MISNYLILIVSAVTGPVDPRVKTKNIWDDDPDPLWVEVFDGWCNEHVLLQWDNNGINYQIEIHSPSDDWYIGPIPTSGEPGECYVNDFVSGGLPESTQDPYNWQVYVQYEPGGDYYGSEEPEPDFFVDRTMPSGSMVINNGDEWTNSTEVELLLTFSDSLSGMHKMHFRNEEEPWSSWEDYTTLKSWILSSGEGLHEVTCQVRDKAGNPYFAQDTIMLDETVPFTICTLEGEMQGGVYISNVTVTLNAIDNLSGVDFTMYKLDDGDWILYDQSFIVSDEGEHTVWFYSVDIAQNIEEIKICTFTIQFPGEPDLDCEGELRWTDVKPGDVVSGSFEVSNIGDPGSLLNWEIKSKPDWGDWTFDPSSGTGLTPEGSPISVDVEVEAPDEQNMEYEGEIKIVNSDDESDFCVIPVYLKTPVSSFHQRILQVFGHHFPFLYWLFSQLKNFINVFLI